MGYLPIKGMSGHCFLKCPDIIYIERMVSDAVFNPSDFTVSLTFPALCVLRITMSHYILSTYILPNTQAEC